MGSIWTLRVLHKRLRKLGVASQSPRNSSALWPSADACLLVSPWGSKFLNIPCFGASAMQTRPTLSYLETQGYGDLDGRWELRHPSYSFEGAQLGSFRGRGPGT